MRRFTLSGAVLTMRTMLWCLLPQLEARQRRLATRKHVKSTSTFIEPTGRARTATRVATDGYKQGVVPGE